MAQVISKDQAMREGELAVIDYLNGGLQDTFDTVNKRIDDNSTHLGKRITDEVDRAEAKENALNAKIVAETTARETADTTLTNDVNGLSEKLSAETTERETADNAESSARETADNELSSRINTQASTVTDVSERLTNLETRYGNLHIHIVSTGTTGIPTADSGTHTQDVSARATTDFYQPSSPSEVKYVPAFASFRVSESIQASDIEKIHVTISNARVVQQYVSGAYHTYYKATIDYEYTGDNTAIIGRPLTVDIMFVYLPGGDE